MEYLPVEQAVQQIIDIGKRMYEKGFVAANDGNITCKVAPDVILATPTNVSKGFMTPDMIVKMRLDGTVVEECAYQPSSEVKMHLRVYQENPEVMAVTHAHPPVSSSFAVAGICLDMPILTEAVVALGCVPVAKYATPGTQEVPDSIAPFCRKYNAVMLANHGTLTWGDSITQAFYRMESVEHYAAVSMNVRNIMGQYNLLSREQVDFLMQRRAKEGIRTGGEPVYAEHASNMKDVLPREGLVEQGPKKK